MPQQIVHFTRFNRRTFLGAAAAASGTVLTSAILGACSLPGGGPAPSRVRLSSATDFPTNLPSVGWKLLVEEPKATLSINTARVAVLKPDKTIGYLDYMEWASRAPEMVMELLTESFKNSNRILTVGDRRSRLRPNIVLESELTAFHLEQSVDRSGIIEVGLNAMLQERPRRRMLSSTSFSERVAVQTTDTAALKQGFDTALRAVMVDTVDWTLRTGSGV